MRRFWIGIIILAVFLVLGLWSCYLMDNMHTQISQALEQAAAAVLSGDAVQGITLAKQAHIQWQENWHLTAFLADHAPMDEIDALFAQALYYADTHNNENFAALCARLARLLEAVGEAHTLNWWNLL